MGVSTPTAAPAARPAARLPGWARSPVALRRAALASVVANVAIVVTGGAVRLTDSGLGCPTWPNCNPDSFVATSRNGIHGLIENTNRGLTVVLVVIALGTWLLTMVARRERTLATVAAFGIPAQAVLGGLTVLTHLNPWLVAAHFLLSMALVAVTFALWTRLRAERAGPVDQAGVRALALLTAGVTAVVLVVGTVVTGAGPHAGDTQNGTVRRIGVQVSSMAQLHADLVMLLVGLTIGLVVVVNVVHAARPLRRAATTLLAIVLAQGLVGYTQYFLHVPPLLVGLHMLGACLVWLAALNVVAGTRLRTAG